MNNSIYFSYLGNPARVWTISALNGHVQKLNAVHQIIWDNFQSGDKIIYMGNYLGNPDIPDLPDIIDTALMFKASLIQYAGADAGDIVFLRGIYEEMWQKLLQLQFAYRPQDVLQWLLQQGVEGILNHYGTTAEDGFAACRGGVMTITRWTTALRHTMRQHHGHEQFYNSLKRAAYTHNTDKDNGLLFVHAGLDQSRPLHTQKDSFWWGAQKFETITDHYDPFRYVIRGYDPEHKGIDIRPATISLDGGCPVTGHVICSEITENGDIRNLIST